MNPGHHSTTTHSSRTLDLGRRCFLIISAARGVECDGGGRCETQRERKREREGEVMGKAATSRVNLGFIDLVGELERRCKVKLASNEETGSFKTSAVAGAGYIPFQIIKVKRGPPITKSFLLKDGGRKRLAT